MLEKAAEKGLDDLFNRGVLGTACAFLILLLVVAGWVIKALYSDLKVCNASALKNQGDLITAATATRDGLERLEEVLKGLKTLIEARNGGVGDLSTQLQLVMAKVQHGFGNLANSMESFVRLAESGRFGPGSPPMRRAFRLDLDDDQGGS